MKKAYLIKEKKKINQLKNSGITYISLIVTLLLTLILAVLEIRNIINFGFSLKDFLVLVLVLCLGFLAIDFLIKHHKER